MIGAPPLLAVEGLAVRFGDAAPAVRDASFTLGRGEALGLIGELGSGKTVTGLAIMGLLDPPARVEARAMRFDGICLAAGERALAGLRGRRIGMVFQDPVGSFNPAKTIGWHLRHALRRAGADPATAAARLASVGLHDPERALAAYPHELSGGMLQRALIAVVVALAPDLLIADEPTTNLDNVVERGILALLRDHQRRSGAGLLFITHDLTLARDLCDWIAVMYAGEIVETGRTRDVLDAPRHPYTAALLSTARSLEAGDAVLAELPGEAGGAPASGCRFAARCPLALTACRSADPPLVALPGPHLVRCVRPHG